MTEPEPPVDKLAVQRLRRQVDGFARGLGVDVETTRQIVEKVVADMMTGRDDDDRLTEARKRLLIATE